MISVAIIDSHPVTRRGISSFLGAQYSDFDMLNYDNINSFKDSLSDRHYDLIIIGLFKSADPDGLSNNFVREMKIKHPDSACIIYDDQPDYQKIMKFLKSGVNGYLCKNNNTSELAECIFEVLNGEHYLSSEVIRLISNGETTAHRLIGNLRTLLTRREMEIANYLSEGKSTSWISAWLSRKPSTISTIKANIFRKLQVDNIVKLREVIVQSQAS